MLSSGYLNMFELWCQVTTALNSLNAFKIWKDWSKQSSDYNNVKNDKYGDIGSPIY